MGRMKAVSQGLVFLLMADAGWVCWGLLHQRNMWAWIVLYWALLTVKNAVEFTSSIAAAPPQGEGLTKEE